LSQNPEDKTLFPILRGESVGESGEINGLVVIICKPEELNREWKANEIAVLKDDMEQHFLDHPGDLDELFENVTAVLAEFGESIGQFAATAYQREALGLVKLRDATYVLENNMHIRVVALENVGEVFFID
jgi:hypothetical protein